MLKHGILGLLNYGPMTGYEIMLTFKNSLCYFWTAQTSQIYRELQTLKKNGLVSDNNIHQEGKPDKVQFSITEEGKHELKHWLTDDSTKFDTRQPILMKTFFLGEASIAESIDFFSKLNANATEFLKAMDLPLEMIEMYKHGVDDPERKSLYWKMTVEYGRMYGKMIEEWTNNCITKLKEYDDNENINN
ncbi:MAG: PadR family transcriptional regulator [Lachnospiraceae bacterium]|nr:PadR family transcriptional regulator [Lachnospiraceae bacterium]